MIDEMSHRLSRIPGMDLNFSQNIQDNVEEAMSGVKGENSLKLFGDDFETLSHLADQIAAGHAIRQMASPMSASFVLADNPASSFVSTAPRLRDTARRCGRQRYQSRQRSAVPPSPRSFKGIAGSISPSAFRSESRNGPEAMRAILLPTPDGSRVPSHKSQMSRPAMAHS